MDRWNGKVALVTGASAGIGRAISERLVEQGLKVVGIARRKERLEEIQKELSSKKGKFYPFQADVTKEGEILEAFQWTKENVGPVSVLVNNSGIMRSVLLSECATEVWRESINVNVLALCIATREAIKQMKESKIDGHIIHINSIAGHKVLNMPGANIYPATKHAVTALTETLRLELSNLGSNIKVTSMSPGYVQTEILETAGFSSETKKVFDKLPSLKAIDVADAALYVLSTPPSVQISELTIQPVGEKF